VRANDAMRAVDARHMRGSAEAMYFVWVTGTRRGGKVDECGDTHVVTQYSHLNGLPFAPGNSELILGKAHRIEIPRQGLSTFAGYMRIWPAVFGFAMVFVASAMDTAKEQWFYAGLSAVGFAGFAAAFFLGRLSREEILRRRAYSAVTGWSADPALLVHGNPTLPEHLRVDLAARAERLAPDGYRAGHGDWAAVALTASAADPSFLAMALTLARIERPEAHDRIWARLAPRIDEVPRSIQPLVTSDGAPAEVAETAATDDAPVWTPTVALADTRGRSIESGYDVTLPRNAYAPPTVCASCLAPAEGTRPSKGGVQSATIEVPYCRPCRAHAGRSERRWSAVQLGAVIAGSLAGAIGLVPGLGMATAAAIAASVAALIAIAVSFALPSRRAIAPASIARDAARVVAASRGAVTLFCTNDEWSRRLADRFGGTRTPRRRPVRGLFAMVPFAVMFAAPASALAFHLANPEVHVDNGTGAPIAVWVDGARVATIEPAFEPSGARDLPTVRVPYGARKLGWSAVSAAAPAATSEVTIAFNGNHLYDPGARHCYYIDAMIYGTVNDVPKANGPLPLGDVYTLPHIHNWFRENPHEIQTKSGGEIHYAIKRAPACDAAKHCSLAERETFWMCIGSADTDDEIGNCRDLLRETCPAP